VRISYVLPLRWQRDNGLEELTAYLEWLAARAQVIVVDGSPPRLFERHHARWAGLCLHVPPDEDLRFANGKVKGVHTAMRRAAHDPVIIADDDVRYDAAGLAAVASLLRTAELVRPQNYFAPCPWHAQWDTARSLLNRAFGRDWPGTFGIRASTFRRMGGYDGDVLFENLELLRTVQAYGGRVWSPLGLYVRRIPPTARGFWSQRVRQAYDEFARPWLLALWLAIIPTAIALTLVAPAAPFLIAALAIVAAEYGRRRAGGHRVFSPIASFLAPVWLSERGLTSWAAVVSRITHGGIGYGGATIARAATPRRYLARDVAQGAEEAPGAGFLATGLR
jgi:hypothetical protein